MYAYFNYIFIWKAVQSHFICKYLQREIEIDVFVHTNLKSIYYSCKIIHTLTQ